MCGATWRVRRNDRASVQSIVRQQTGERRCHPHIHLHRVTPCSPSVRNARSPQSQQWKEGFSVSEPQLQVHEVKWCTKGPRYNRPVFMKPDNDLVSVAIGATIVLTCRGSAEGLGGVGHTHTHTSTHSFQLAHNFSSHHSSVLISLTQSSISYYPPQPSIPLPQVTQVALRNGPFDDGRHVCRIPCRVGSGCKS